MRANDLKDALMNWTVLNSGHQNREYIGLSGIGDCEQVIYDRVRRPEKPSVDEHLKFKVGYEFEALVIERLKALRVYQPSEVISLYDGLVQGHTDGRINADVLEIKSVPSQRFLPVDGKLPHRVFWQIQAYMHFLQRRWCQVIYIARDTGQICTVGIRYREEIGQEIEVKAGRLVRAVLNYDRPGCTCGHHLEEAGQADWATSSTANLH